MRDAVVVKNLLETRDLRVESSCFCGSFGFVGAELKDFILELLDVRFFSFAVGAGYEVSVHYGICMLKLPTVVPFGPALSV
jgi:hypothetical protein